MSDEKEKISSVLMLSQTFYPALGGSEKQAFELSRSLAARGVKVTVYTRRLDAASPAYEETDGFRILRAARLGSGLADSAWFMVKSFFHILLNAGEYQVVHVHLASSPAVAAALACRLRGLRLLVKLGGGKGVDEVTLSSRTLAGRLKLAFFSWAKPRLLVMNKEVYDWLRSEPSFKDARLVPFRNGVDTGKYTPPLYAEKMKAKEDLDSEGLLTFLFVGRLSPEKRVREFVEAVAEIFAERRDRPAMRLLIVGSGPEEAAIRSEVKAAGLEDAVRLEGRHDELLPYYRAADVFILPSESEGLSNSMLEAMSSGLAVLASRVGGAREAVAEGENGFLFDPFSRQELKDNMLRFLAEPSLAVKMGEKSRQVAVSRYSMVRVTEDLLEIYAGGEPAA